MNLFTFREQVSAHSRIFTECSSMLGSTRFSSVAVPSPTGRRIFQPHIDLGREKYGGPFTTEEVEDAKTSLRILPLLLCLFGYQLAGDGYSAPEHVQLLRTNCPSLPVLLLVVANPLHMSALVTLIGIPLYRLVIKKLNLACLWKSVDAHKNVDRSVPLTTTSYPIHHNNSILLQQSFLVRTLQKY